MDALTHARLRRLAILLTLLGVIVATALLLVPMSGTGPGIIPDKLAHGIVFFGLALPALILPARRWRWVIAGLALYGGAIELIQPLVGREAAFLDWLANLAGLALAGLVAPPLRAVLVWLVSPRARQTE
jgi:VanZ family protein